MNEEDMAGNATTPPTVKKPKQKLGRPSGYSQKIANEICKRIIEGQNILQLCKADDMPSRDTIHQWLVLHSEFSDNYARASKIRREYKFYEMERIARTEVDVNRARLINDTIKWQLSKEEPKKYGDKLDHTTGGKELPAPILNIMVSPNTTNDNKREYIEAEVPKNAALDQPTQNSNIMDDIDG
jgi:hypothetical protein